MKKRLIAGTALLLLAVLLVSVLAVGASGATLYTNVYVGGSGDAHYTTLADALTHVAENGTVHIDGTCVVPASFSWPKNGRRITVTGGVLDISAFSGKDLGIGDHATFTSLQIKTGDGKTSLFANGNAVTVSESVTFAYGSDVKLYFYGGAASGSVATTALTLNAGIYEMIYGGGRNSTVTGDTHVTVGGTVNQGKVDVTVHNSSNYVYGGGEGASSLVGGDTHVTFTGNAMAIQVIGGSNKGKVTGNTNLLFSGGNSMGLYGGHMGIDTGKDAYVTITGGQLQQVFGASNGANFTGNVYLRVLGGKITRRIYGGCYNNLDTSGFTQNFGVDGHIYLTMDAAATVSFGKDSYTDHGIWARSRHNNVNEKAGVTEKGTILYTSTSAQSAFNGKLGYQTVYGLGEFMLMLEDQFGQSQLNMASHTEGAYVVAYTVNGNVITETCGDSTATVTLGVADPAACVYTGSPITAASLTVSGSWRGEPVGEISYRNNVNAGTATATAAHYYGTLSLNFTVQNATQPAPVLTKTDESIRGKGDGSIAGLTTAMEWSTDGVTYAPVTAAMVGSAKGAGTYYFRLPAKTNYDPSPATVITVEQGRMLTVTFRAEGFDAVVREVAWGAALTDIPSVPARVGYTQTAPYWSVSDFTGITQDVTVDAVYTPNVYTVSLSNGAGYTLTATANTVRHGDTLTLSFALLPGYSRTGAFAFAVNGTPVDLDAQGRYTLRAESDVAVTVAGVADVTAPTATVTAGAYTWTAFPADLSFSLRYKTALEVAIAAADTAGGALTVEYVRSDRCLSEAEVGALTAWGTYTAPITLGTQAYTVIYFRVTDAAGNTSYFATAGMVYTLTVTFTAEGSDPIVRDVVYGEDLGDIPTVPARVGYTQTAPYWSVSDFTGITQNVSVVAVYTPNVYTVTLSGGTGYTLTATANTVRHGETLTLSLALLPGYSRTGAFAFTVNGAPVDLDAQGRYTLRAESDVVVTVTGVADVTAPTATVTVGGQSWTSYPAELSYTLYHNTSLTAAIAAADSAGGAVTVEFMRAALCLPLQTIRSMSAGWSTYTAPLSIPASREATVIYFRVTDAAGNVAYFATTGMVGDTLAPVLNGAEDGGAYLSGTAFTVTDANLDSVTFDGTPIVPADGIYALPRLNKTGTLTATDKAGNVTAITLTLRAVWTVTYVADGETVATFAVAHGDGVDSVPAIPSKAGYTVTAPVWDRTADNVTADLTVIAVYTADPVVTPPAADDTPSADAPSVDEGVTEETPNANKTDDGAESDKKGSALPVILAIVGGVAVVGGGAAFVLIRKKKRV